MKSVILVFHILVAISVISLILLQSSKGGLGSGVGGGDFYRSRRGAEKVVFTATIVLSVIFFITSIINLVIH
jgi:preprotein translocase subunit SecG